MNRPKPKEGHILATLIGLGLLGVTLLVLGLLFASGNL